MFFKNSFPEVFTSTRKPKAHMHRYELHDITLVIEAAHWHWLSAATRGKGRLHRESVPGMFIVGCLRGRCSDV